MTNSRRKFTAEQKAAIVRRHLKGKESIATIAEELSIQPTQIHQWVAVVMEQAEKAFEKTTKSDKASKLAEAKIKSECIRPSCTATKDEAEKRIAKYVHYYNTVRLHSAIGYVTPADCPAGLSEVIGEERDRKLETARKQRQEKRAAAKQVA